MAEHNTLANSGLKELLFWLVGLRRSFRVAGASMAPTLKAGAIVLVNPKAYLTKTPNPGHIVVALHPYKSNIYLIKRITTVSEEETYYLMGDNPSAVESTDSRAFGPIARNRILGRVTSQF